MKTTNTKKFLTGIATTLAALSIATAANASSHREAPAISFDPAADNTDVWAWVTPGTHDKLYIVAAYNPLEEPSGGPNFHKFSDDVLYEIHVARGNKSLKDEFTYEISFRTEAPKRVDPADLKAPLGGGKEFFAQLSGQQQTYWVTKVDKKGGRTILVQGAPVAPVNIGPRTNAVVYKPASGKYDDAYASTFIQTMLYNEGRAFAGPRDDGFYVDLARTFDLANLLEGTATDGVSGYNCHTIALEIPTNELTFDKNPPAPGANDKNTLGIWASASRRSVNILRHDGDDDSWGPYVQVSRLGLPLVNEALIGIQDKDKFNRSKPAKDVQNFGAYFLNPVIVRDAEAVGIYGALGVPQSTVDALKKDRTDILDVINLKASGHDIPLSATGDVLRVDMGLDSGFPNGRPLVGGAKPNQEQADVTDVLLSVILAKGTLTVADGVNHNDKDYLKEFPYLPLPWEGYSQGHGKPAP
ncbi:MAG: DUF4331 domain-containing protein [Polyangiaceae bacterium]